MAEELLSLENKLITIAASSALIDCIVCAKAVNLDVGKWIPLVNFSLSPQLTEPCTYLLKFNAGIFSVDEFLSFMFFFLSEFIINVPNYIGCPKGHNIIHRLLVV